MYCFCVGVGIFVTISIQLFLLQFGKFASLSIFYYVQLRDQFSIDLSSKKKTKQTFVSLIETVYSKT